MRNEELKFISIDEIEDYDESIEAILIRGDVLTIPEGFTASDVVSQLDVPIATSFLLKEDDTKLEIISVIVGTKA